MGTEDIEIGQQWDVVQTMAELTDLRDRVVRFMSHTIKTMSTPRVIHTPFGDTEADGVEHPMGFFIGTIDSCQEGCFRRYGEDMFKQGKLFDVHVMGATDGREA